MCKQKKQRKTSTAYFPSAAIFVVTLLISSCSSFNKTEPAVYSTIKINQVGYLPEAPKTVYSSAPAQTFIIRDTKTGSKVFSGTMQYSGMDADTEMDVYTGDFTNFQETGNYFIEVVGAGESYPFSIRSGIYNQVLTLTERFFYLQRSGIDIVVNLSDGNEITVKKGHTLKASLWNNYSVKKDVSGGWYDAGDFGRYIPTAAFSVNQLLYAFELNPEAHTDGSLDIPESINGIPDILDEIMWELSWMMKMQREDGAVYHKVTTRDYPPMGTPPSEDNQSIYLFGPTSADTAYFTAAMARSALILKPYDSAFANRYKAAALKSYQWLKQNPSQFPMGGFQNPPPSKYPMQGGYDFIDSEDHTRMWAAAEMFALTADSEILSDFEKLYQRSRVDGEFIKMDWSEPYGLALAAYLDAAGIGGNNTTGSLYSQILQDYRFQADAIVKTSSQSLFNTSLKGRNGPFAYVWGSNQVVSANGFELLLAYKFLGDELYLDTAYNQLQYLLGCNGLSKIYLSGFDSNPVRNPHHNLSLFLKEPIPGIVTEGPNGAVKEGSGGDVVLENLWEKKTPPALCYADNSESWATNEPTIDANASFAALVSWFSGKVQ